MIQRVSATPQAFFLNAISQQNPTLPIPFATDPVDYDPTLVTIGQPTAWTPADGSSSYNTKVTLAAPSSSPYSGQADVYYSRQDIASYFAAANIVPSVPWEIAQAGWQGIVPYLSSRYSVPFDGNDVPQTPYVFDPLAKVFPLTLPPTSLLFTGTLMVSLDDSNYPMTSAIVQTTLPGLNPPIPDLSAFILNTTLDGLAVA